MANLKYSRQRAAIKEYLSHTYGHPTADTVYLHIRKEFPNISLGTVYRNLNLLADMGEAIKISTPEGGDRFDGRTAPHYHVVCSRCSRIFDLELDEQHIPSINWPTAISTVLSLPIALYSTEFAGNASQTPRIKRLSIKLKIMIDNYYQLC